MSFIGKLNSRGGRPFTSMLSRKNKLSKDLAINLNVKSTGNQRKEEIKTKVKQLLDIESLTKFQEKVDPKLSTSNPRIAEQEILSLIRSQHESETLKNEIARLKRIHQDNKTKIEKLQRLEELSVPQTPSGPHHLQQYSRNPTPKDRIGFLDSNGRTWYRLGGRKKPFVKNPPIKKSTKKKLSKKKSPKVHTGPRGGKYIIKRGKKIYQ